MTAYEPVVRQDPVEGGLGEVVDIILDKGMVIDAYVRVSLLGIELLTIDARIVVASVDTYLRYASAVNRLDLREKSQAQKFSSVLGANEDRVHDEAGDHAFHEAGDRVGADAHRQAVETAINRMAARPAEPHA